MHKDLHSELEQIFRILIAQHEPQLNPKRPEQLALMHEAAKAACEVVEAQAASSGRLVVAQLVTELVVGMLLLPLLPTVVMAEVKDNIPDWIGVLPTGSLKQQLDVTVHSVWAKLGEQFWTAPPGESVTSSPLGIELASLSNDLVHVEILAPVAKWWWVVLVLYHVWFLFLVLIQVLRFVRGHAYYGSTHMTMARLLR
jgi:hypothetical protein